VWLESCSTRARPRSSYGLRGKAGSYTIPNSVTSLGYGAFFRCTNLANVTVPNGVTNIGKDAFYTCTSLTRLNFKGNAPSLGLYVFLGANNAIIYYLPGTTNWGATFGGHPTALWQPQVQTSDTSFGVQTNQFGFNIAWADGWTVAVEICTNLANPTWLPVATNTLTGGSFYFSDPDWTNSPRRFYRLRWP